MDTFTVDPLHRLRPLFSKNPLVRFSDRIEAAAVLLIVLVALLAAPIAGAIGTAVQVDRAQSATAEQSQRHRVLATAVQDSTPVVPSYRPIYFTELRWAADGATGSSRMNTGFMKAGDTVEIWVDSSGRHAVTPRTRYDAGADGVSAALGAWGIAVGGSVAVWAALRWRLNRSRYQAWERDLEDLADNGGHPAN